jgi:hypothetical protein
MKVRTLVSVLAEISLVRGDDVEVVSLNGHPIDSITYDDTETPPVVIIDFGEDSDG